MSLFQLGIFKLHSGEHSPYRIDADALTDDDIEAVAYMLRLRLPTFGSVEGVPNGGLRLAAAMQKYARAVGAPLLICDDVYTTGGSMKAHRGGREAIGAVIFARRPVTLPWVMALFTMAEELER